MQGLATAREKPPAQEQWRTMKKQSAEQWKQSKIWLRADVPLRAIEILRRRRMGSMAAQ
jgi:hypothetical protein